VLDEKKNMVESPIHNVPRIVPGIEKLSKGVVSDPIADLLVCLRHGQVRGLSSVYTPASSVKRGILAVLREEGFIRGFSEVPYECRFSSEASALAFMAEGAKPLWQQQSRSKVTNPSQATKGRLSGEASFCLPFSLFPLVRWRRSPIACLRAPRGFQPYQRRNKFGGGVGPPKSPLGAPKGGMRDNRGFQGIRPPQGVKSSPMAKSSPMVGTATIGNRSMPFRPLNRGQEYGRNTSRAPLGKSSVPSGSQRMTSVPSVSKATYTSVGQAGVTPLRRKARFAKFSGKPRYLAACYKHFSDRQQVSLPRPVPKGPRPAHFRNLVKKTDGGRLSLAGWKAKGLAEAKRVEDAKKPTWMRFRRVTPYKDLAYQPVAFGPFDFKRMRKQVEGEMPFGGGSAAIQEGRANHNGFMYFKVELCVGVVGIRSTKRISRPGSRVYATAAEVKDYLTSSLRSFGVHSRMSSESGLGCVVLSTNRGVLSYRQAQVLGLGGEVLCAVA
jgi:ribosomal protein S8